MVGRRELVVLVERPFSLFAFRYSRRERLSWLSLFRLGGKGSGPIPTTTLVRAHFSGERRRASSLPLLPQSFHRNVVGQTHAILRQRQCNLSAMMRFM